MNALWNLTRAPNRCAQNLGNRVLFGVLIVGLLCCGCSVRRPLERFRDFRPLDGVPAEFANLNAAPAQATARISLRAPGLRGTADGIIRHARDGQYLIELYGRGELFLKVYFTRTQTVLWPAVGSPEFFTPEESPTLKETVHVLLPAWRLDDVMPIRLSKSAGSWSTNRTGDGPLEVVQRSQFDPLWKQYRRGTGRNDFPYRKVTLYSESGKSRLTWSLQFPPESLSTE